MIIHALRESYRLATRFQNGGSGAPESYSPDVGLHHCSKSGASGVCGELACVIESRYLAKFWAKFLLAHYRLDSNH
jgi:hypothetical protein